MVMTGVGEGEETAEQVGGGSWWLGTGTYMQAFPGVRERSPQISAGASESHHWLEVLASILQCKTTSRLFIFHKPQPLRGGPHPRLPFPNALVTWKTDSFKEVAMTFLGFY